MAERTVGKFLKAPEAPEPATEPVGPVAAAYAATGDWLAGYGIATGGPGAILLALAGLCLVVGLVRIGRLLHARLVQTVVAATVVDYEAAEGSYLPVAEYRDARGRLRRATLATPSASDPTGRLLRLRIDGTRPRPAPAPRPPIREAIGLVLPFLLGGGLAVAGLTGRLGPLALPGF